MHFQGKHMSPDSAALITTTCLEFPGEGSLFPAALPNVLLSLSGLPTRLSSAGDPSGQGLGSKINVRVLAAQSCLILCDLMAFSPPGFSVHGISQGKNTGVGCHFLLQGCSTCDTKFLQIRQPSCL